MPWEGSDIHVADVVVGAGGMVVQNDIHIAGERLKISAAAPAWTSMKLSSLPLMHPTTSTPGSIRTGWLHPYSRNLLARSSVNLYGSFTCSLMPPWTPRGGLRYSHPSRTAGANCISWTLSPLQNLSRFKPYMPSSITSAPYHVKTKRWYSRAKRSMKNRASSMYYRRFFWVLTPNLYGDPGRYTPAVPERHLVRSPTGDSQSVFWRPNSHRILSASESRLFRVHH